MVAETIHYILEFLQKQEVLLYSSTLQKIPPPKKKNFIVFYNGTERPEDRWEDLLSDAYENLTEIPNLELKVLTLNINEGHNEELMEQCLILKEYAQYVAKVRNYTKEMKLDVALECADLLSHLKVNGQQLRESIRNQSYKPMPVKRVEIPKADGSKRKLGIPTVTDRVVQQATAQVLTPIYERKFHENSYGFKPGKMHRRQY